MVKSIGLMGSFFMPKTKRNHYIPKAYLRHFASPNDPEKVHVFNKESGRWILTSILNAGVWTGFYSDEDEKRLNAEVESPARSALTKLRDGQPINAQERRKVAAYMESMIKRVPYARREFLKRIPKQIEDMRMKADQVAIKLNSSPRAVVEGLARLEGELSQADVMTSKIAQYQWTSEEFIDALVGINWTVLVARGLDRFVTGDNPGFFDWHHGLINAESEVVFPLSPGAALHGGRRKLKDGSIERVDATSSQVKETNRRMILGAERFIYSHRELPWVKDVIRNPVRQWKRILN